MKFFDITVLAEDMSVSDIPDGHPNAGNPLPRAFKAESTFDIVLCDGQVLRNHNRATYRERREARRLTNTQLALGVEHVRIGGTMTLLHHKVEAWDTAHQQDLTYVEWGLYRLMLLLRWTEQERLVMHRRYLAPVEEAHCGKRNATVKAAQRPLPTGRRTRRLEVPTILGQPNVTKVTYWKRDSARQKPKTPGCEPTIQEPNTTENGPNLWKQKYRDSKPRLAKTEPAFRQSRPRRALRVDRSADGNVDGCRQDRHGDGARPHDP